MILLLALACKDNAADTTPIDSGEQTTVSGTYESATYCAECHPTHYAEWQQSMHAYAALSPVFDAMAGKAFRDSGGEVGTFCTGCHTPQGTLDGEPGFTTAAERSELSREGVTCTVCHTAVSTHVPIGNTSLENDLSSDMITGPFSDPVAVGLGEHTSVQSDFLTSPELCGSCHDVFMFPGLRIEEAYTEFLTSPAAAAGQRCQDCHMGPEPGVVSERQVGPIAVMEGQTFPDRTLSSHRFIGPDISLLDDFPYPDDLEASAAALADYTAQRDILLRNAVRIGGLYMANTDEGFQVEIEVENLTAGHNVPTGFTSERQLWVQLKVIDNTTDEVVFITGDTDSHGDLRNHHSRDVRSGLLSEDHNLINFQSENLAHKREYTSDGTFSTTGQDNNAATTTEVTFPFDANQIAKHSLEPLEIRTMLIQTGLPEGSYTVKAALRYRNLPPYVLHALLQDELIERLDIVDIDTKSVTN